MVTSRNAERDDDLALFHEMHKCERERKSKPLLSASGNEALLASRLGSASLCKGAAPSQPLTSMYKREDLLTSDAGKNDYDWLLTPPGTPLITATENDPTSMDFKGLPNLVRSLAAIKTSRGLPMNAKPEALSRTLRPDASSSSKLGRSNLYSSASAPIRRVSSLAPCSTPTLRPASRPTTPTRGPVSSSGTRNTHAPSSSTRSVSGPSSRSTTPLRRPLSQSQPAHSSQPTSSRPSPALKASSGLPTKSTPTSRGSSPTMRPRVAAWQPSAMPGFSLEPPPNLRTTIPARSLSNSRGASIGPSRPSQVSTSSSITTGVAAPTSASLARTASSHPDTAVAADRSRRQSCSPSITRGRSTPERPSPAASSGNAKADGTPAVKSHKMVEKLMQSRRAAASAPSLQDTPVLQLKRAVKPTTPTKKDAESFGRNVSRRSMDMALRHMDLRQSASNGLRSLAPNMYPPFYSVRSVSGRGRPGYSPITTSSTASSEHSMSFMRDPEGSSEVGEEVSSEVGSKASPMSLSDSIYSVTKDARGNSWMSSPDYRDDSVELMKLFRQGIEKLSGSESPLVCQHGGGSSNCDLCNVKNRLQSLSNNMRASLQRSEDVSKGSSPFSSSSIDLSSPGQC